MYILHYFELENLSVLLFAVALSIPIGTYGAIVIAKLTREKRFKEIAILSLLSIVSWNITVVIFSYLNFGVKSFALGIIVQSCIESFCAWVLVSENLKITTAPLKESGSVNVIFSSVPSLENDLAFAEKIKTSANTVFITGNNTDALGEEIFKGCVDGILIGDIEKGIEEFVFENKRWFDLVRTDRALAVLPPFLANYTDAIGNMTSRDQYYYPIPIRPLQDNENIDQNPGY